MNFWDQNTEALKTEVLTLLLMSEEDAFKRHNETKSEMISAIAEEIKFRESREDFSEGDELLEYLVNTTYTI